MDQSFGCGGDQRSSDVVIVLCWFVIELAWKNRHCIRKMWGRIEILETSWRIRNVLVATWAARIDSLAEVHLPV